MFNLRAGAYRYRPLRQPMSGWDVYGLQKCLLGAGYPLPQFGADGYFGTETRHAAVAFQNSEGLVADGIAGVLTQRQLVFMLAAKEQVKHRLCEGHIQGQIESESSHWVGNYTAPYENGKRDLGLVMQHLLPDEVNCLKAFNGPVGIARLGGFLRFKKDAYYGQVGAKTHERAWQLAAGAWNAPAWTDTLARGGTISASQKEHIESYILRVTAFVTEWTP